MASIALPIKKTPDDEGAPPRAVGLRLERSPQRPLLAPLRAPLAVKLIGPHVAAMAALIALVQLAPSIRSTAATAAASCVLVAAYIALVVIALRPVRDLEAA